MSSSHPTPKKWKPNTPRPLCRQAGKERGGSPKGNCPGVRGPTGEGREFSQPLHTAEPSSGTAACLSFNYILRVLQTKAANSL